MYCKKNGVECNSSNSFGECNLTMCNNHDVLAKKFKDTMKELHGEINMCDNCRSGWSGKCDIDQDPKTCSKWEPY